MCTNNFRNSTNSTGLTFYRIPKKESIRREYIRLLRNDNLKSKSESTRVYSAHWTGGKKLSRDHLPSIFPWSKKKTAAERRILSWTESTANVGVKKRKADVSTSEIDQGPLIDIDHEETIQASFCDAETQTEITVEILDRLEAELKEIREKKEKVAREKDELSRETKRLQHLVKNPKFDILKFKDNDEDVEFYTGLPRWDALVLLYDMVNQKARNLNYGSYEKKGIGSEQKLGRPRALTLFEEFVLTLMRLRLGLFQKDLAHRFNVSETTVSGAFNLSFQEKGFTSAHATNV